MHNRCRKRNFQVLRELSESRRLDAVVDALGVNLVSWFVLERRLGPSNEATLENVSKDVGLTRERVRQLQQKAVQALFCNLDLLMPVLRDLDGGLHASWLSPETREKEAALLSELANVASRGGWSEANSDAIRSLVIAVRALVSEHPEIAQQLPSLTFAACLLDPPVRRHELVAKNLDNWEREEREQHRNWTYNELAEHVLRQAGKPLHWRTMCERAEALGRRINFSAGGFFNAVQANDAIFARVDPGTYGLTEWGLSDVENYPDIIASVLSASGQPLAAGAIYHAVSSRRPVKHSTLTMLLWMHPRFYESAEGTFGLRVWVPERSKQTLRTPRWQIEKPDSFERVKRAQERGYNVESIVENDRVSA